MRMVTPYFTQRNLTNELFRDFDSYFPAAERKIELAYDISETEDKFQVSLDVPGMKQEDLKIELHENVLTVSGERKRHEKSFGNFSRKFTIPANVQSDKVEARYENGVLELTLPKVPVAKPRQIEIQSGLSQAV